MTVINYTHFRGEVLEELSRKRLIEIIRDLVWETETRRQCLARIVETNADFRSSLPDDWESDPLNDICVEAKRLL